MHISRAPRRTVVRLSALALLTLGLVACGDDSGESTSSTSPAAPATPATSPVVPATVPAVPATPATSPAAPSTTAGGGNGGGSGGGGMQAGAPSFESFEVSSPVACQGGNAEVTMSYTTLNAVDMKIKIGDGSFEETAGYGPDETSVVASIPCSGAGSSKVQMQACTEDGECADSPARDVTITG